MGEDTGKKEIRYWRRYRQKKTQYKGRNRQERASVMKKIQIGKSLGNGEDTDRKETRYWIRYRQTKTQYQERKG